VYEDSDEGLMSLSDPEEESKDIPELPELEKRKSSGPRQNYILPSA
jgi:hypothetical protein